MRVWVACLGFSLMIGACVITPTPQPSALSTNTPSNIQPSSLPTHSPVPAISSDPYEGLPNITNYPVEVVAGSGQEGSQDGAALQASFKLIGKPCVDPKNGSIYIPDGSKLRKLTPEGQVITFAGNEQKGYLDAKGTNARFYHLVACAIDSDSNVLVSDVNNALIRKIDAQRNVTTFLGHIEADYEFRDGTVQEASLRNPRDLLYLSTGELYITDSFKLRVFQDQKLDTLNRHQPEEASPGGFSSQTQPILTSFDLFGNILWIAADENKNLYVANPQVSTLLKIDAQGIVTAWTDPLYRIEAKGDRIHSPQAIVYDSLRKCLWVISRGSHIYQLSLDGVFRVVLINKPYPITGKYPIEGLNRNGIFMGADHNLYLADAGTHQLKRVILPKP